MKWRWIANRLPLGLIEACFNRWNEHQFNKALAKIYESGESASALNLLIGKTGVFTPTTDPPPPIPFEPGATIEFYVSDFGTHKVVREEDE